MDTDKLYQDADARLDTLLGSISSAARLRRANEEWRELGSPTDFVQFMLETYGIRVRKLPDGYVAEYDIEDETKHLLLVLKHGC